MKPKIIILFTAVVLSSIFTACSKKPLNKKVLTAIKTQIEKKLPNSWNESFLKSENVKVDSIKIIRFGDFNKSGQYWPVKARVIGTYKINLFIETLTKHFNKIGDFKIFKNDYGNWQAELKINN